MPLKQYRDVLPGRLAHQRPPDAQPRAPLRPDHGLPDRSVEEPELREGAGGRRGRAAQGHQGRREPRPRRRRTTRTTSSRASASRSTCAATARTSSAAAGASTTTWATPTPTSCSRRSTRPASASARSSTSTYPTGILQSRRQLLPVRPADREHRQPEPGQHQPAAALRPVAGSALRAALHAPDGVRLVAPAHDEHRVHGRLRRATRDATSARAPRSTRARSTRRRRRRASCAFLGPAAERHRHPRRDQRRRERVQRPDHGRQAPHDARVRLHRDLHAGRLEEQHRHGGRRAEPEQHSGRRAAL